MLNQSVYSKQEMRSTETEEFANVDISAIKAKKSNGNYIIHFNGFTFRTERFNCPYNDGQTWKAVSECEEEEFEAFTLRNLKAMIASYC